MFVLSQYVSAQCGSHESYWHPVNTLQLDHAFVMIKKRVISYFINRYNDGEKRAIWPYFLPDIWIKNKDM
jgi:hypothetical protein